jgi:hypothetical protein
MYLIDLVLQEVNQLFVDPTVRYVQEEKFMEYKVDFKGTSIDTISFEFSLAVLIFTILHYDISNKQTKFESQMWSYK